MHEYNAEREQSGAADGLKRDVAFTSYSTV
jgi:hypothetical protein